MDKNNTLKAVVGFIVAAAAYAYFQYSGTAPIPTNQNGKSAPNASTVPIGTTDASSAPPRVDTSRVEPRDANAQQPHAAGAVLYDLEKDEGRGHTLKKHVGRTDQQLIERLAEERISSASTYTDKETAERCVAAALAQNHERVQGWLHGTDDTRMTLDFNGDAAHPIGRTVHRNATQSKPVHRAKIVLAKDGRGGFFVLTTYPED